MCKYEKYEELRDKLGITDYRVSEATQISRSTFSDWRAGRSKPKIEKIQKLAKFFNVPIEDLLEVED